MRKLTWLIPAVALAIPTFAAEVNEPHNKFPGPVRALGNACDNDAHDPAKCKAAPQPASVPEPGTAALLVLGLGGLALATWRRK